MLKCCWNVFWTDHLQMMIEMMPLFRKRTRTWKGTRKGVDETHHHFNHHLHMISSEDISTTFQHHFKICLLWFLPEKECSFYTHLFWCTEMRWLFISSTASSATGSATGSANGSVASRARTELISSKCDWTRIWAI